MIDDKMRIVKLFSMYHNGEINDESLTYEERRGLSELYDKQIDILKKSNEYRKKKIIQRKNELDQVFRK